MKYIFFLLLLTFTLKLTAQTGSKDDQAVLEKVNHFFEALEKKDTVLYKSLAFTNAQIWVSRKQGDSLRTPMRYIGDDMARLATMKEVIRERPLKMELSLHGNIAVVWAPYTLSLGDTFSHCGIDVFTLLKTVEGWKIVSCVYSVEPDGCDQIKKEYNLK